MNISDELFFNIVKDWEKRNISSEEKGLLIKQFMVERKLTLRGLSKTLGIPHTTIHHWLNGRKEYDVKNSYVPSSVVRMHRNELDFLLDRLLFVLSRKQWRKTSKTERLIADLKSELNKLELMQNG